MVVDGRLTAQLLDGAANFVEADVLAELGMRGRQGPSASGPRRW